jgi:CBS domain-containing protein
MRVPPDLSLTEAARRAMARRARKRFDPLVCVDATGHVVGVVDLRDLILSLAESIHQVTFGAHHAD